MTRANDHHEEKLEQLIDRALRAQPLRRAPLELGVRVLAEIERRAALPWWRNNFAHWPLAARAGFLIASYGVVRLALAAAMSLAAILRSSRIADALNPAVNWLHGGASIISVTADIGASVMRAVPPYWLHDGAVIAVALYAALFGLGAAAYRTLYVTR
jgi:hypothetical protein